MREGQDRDKCKMSWDRIAWDRIGWRGRRQDGMGQDRDMLYNVHRMEHGTYMKGWSGIDSVGMRLDIIG